MRFGSAIGVLAAWLLWSHSHTVSAQAADATAASLTRLTSAAPETPGGRGLLETAIREAQTALKEASLASNAAEDLVGMRTHAGAVLHAADPSLSATGPGLGYGLRRVLGEFVATLDGIAAMDRRADVVLLAPPALAASQGARRDVEQMISLALRIQSATRAPDAAALSREMHTVARQLLVGAGESRVGTKAQPLAGGLLAVQARLGVLVLNRNGAVPSALRQPREQVRR